METIEEDINGEDDRKPESPKPEADVKGETLKAKDGKKPLQHHSREVAYSLPEAPVADYPLTTTGIGLYTSEIKESLTTNYSALTTNNSPLTPDNSQRIVPHPPLTDMEVHHHPKVEKKDIKEYLLEGFMIFIAVMMGFFAESLREHITEKNRAEDYAITLYSDLKLDTADLHGYLTYFSYAKANTDTLMQLLGNNDAKNIPTGKLYYFGLFGGAHNTFTPHDATLMEMKSSGSLRFFGDKVINRKLALYDQLCQSVKLEQEKETGIYVETRKARARIFEFKYNEQANDLYHRWSTVLFGGREAFSPATNAAARAEIDSFKKTNPPLLSYDQTLFNEYIELVRSRFLNVKVSQADSLMAHSTELIGLLKKKYDLKDE